MGESKHGAPWVLGPTGHVIYAAEVEAGEHAAYRPRTELARLSVDDPEVAKVMVASPLMLEALRAEESCECTAPESRFSAYPCAACRERRRAAIRAATGGEP